MLLIHCECERNRFIANLTLVTMNEIERLNMLTISHMRLKLIALMKIIVKWNIFPLENPIHVIFRDDIEIFLNAKVNGTET